MAIYVIDGLAASERFEVDTEKGTVRALDGGEARGAGGGAVESFSTTATGASDLTCRQLTGN